MACGLLCGADDDHANAVKVTRRGTVVDVFVVEYVHQISSLLRCVTHFIRSVLADGTTVGGALLT